jgi:hypothetical protein
MFVNQWVLKKVTAILKNGFETKISTKKRKEKGSTGKNAVVLTSSCFITEINIGFALKMKLLLGSRKTYD